MSINFKPHVRLGTQLVWLKPMKPRGRPSTLVIHLKSPERNQLKRLLRGGHDEVRHIRRAILLLQLDQGKPPSQAAEAAGVSPKTARIIGQRYIQGGLKKALEDDPRPGGAPLLTEKEAHRIIAMVCGPPPEGISRWSIRVIAEEAVRRKIVPRVGKETIRVLLLSNDLKPWLKKNVVHPGGQFRILGTHGSPAKPVRKAA